jgi:UDP-hydrolysing UDP-N-acetyl-D-glucosamine 2-epimerase
MLATGSHLIKSQGLTIDLIKKDGIEPLIAVDMQITSDSEEALCQGIATGLAEFSKVFTQHAFDLLIVLGDRFELLSACNAALIHNLPVAHLHGGEATFGVIDEAIRHSVTKMSALHFVAHETYRKRVIQMGENPQSVFNVGAMGLDNFNTVEAWSKQKLEKNTGLDFSKPVLLVTFHPVTLDESSTAESQANQLVMALEELPYQILATLPNADAGGQQIKRRLENAVEEYPEKISLVTTLGIAGYMAAMQYSAVMVGNSSSGILEAASFQLPVVNIGDRQAGRIQPSNVVNCECQKELILDAIELCFSKAFVTEIKDLQSPYGSGIAAQKIVKTLKDVDLSNTKKLLKKQFYDISCKLAIDKE